MSANVTILAVDNPAYTHGVVWHQLHSEREEICEALLKDSAPSYEDSGAKPTSNERAMNAVNWHRELLQARLIKVDDALDRLVAGTYGECCRCGKWIEDTKLDFDPAIAYCLACWPRVQTNH